MHSRWKRIVWLAAGGSALVALVLRWRPSPVPIVDNPRFVSAAEATWLGDHELVLGVVVAGVSKAYPIPAVAPLEYLNDRVAGAPIGVSW